jgi:parallel beta-helix repeat protein
VKYSFRFIMVIVFAVAATAPAKAVSCGDHIVTDLTLEADLHCSSGFVALTAHEGVTIRLNGHTLSGTDDLLGIDVRGNNVTILGPGRIEGFWGAIRANHTLNFRVEFVSFEGVGGGVFLGHGSHGVVANNSFVNLWSHAVSMTSSALSSVPTSNNLVENNRMENVLFGVELCGDTAFGNRVINNKIVNVTGYGLLLRDQANRNELSGNSVEGAEFAAVAIFSSSRNQILSGRYSDSRTGIWVAAQPLGGCHTSGSSVDSADNEFLSVTLIDNQIGAMFGGSGLGEVRRNRLLDSKIYDNGRGVDLRSESRQNRIQHNAFTGTIEPIIDEGRANIIRPNFF